jgi:hypothetical protein
MDELRIVEEAHDGGYISCGVTEESDNYYVWLLKLFSNGTEDWHLINYNLNGTIMTPTIMNVRAFDIVKTSDNGYLISGGSEIELNVQGEDIWVPTGYFWKIDASGTTEWTEHYYDIGALALDFIYDTLEISTGYVSTGFRIYYDISGTILDYTGFAMETDTTGNLVWHEVFDAGGEDYLTSLCSTTDGGYLLTGWIDSTTVNNGALWMVKIDATGTKQWEKIFDGPGFEYTFGRGCFQTSDGGYIFAGNTGSYGHGNVDVWVIKTDPNGTIKWDKCFGAAHHDYTWTLCKTNDDTYAIAICKDYQWMSGTKEDLFTVQFNEDGFTEWTYLIEEPDKQIPTCICPTSDNGYIISGRTNEIGNDNTDAIIYKLSPAGTNNAPETPSVNGPTKPAIGKYYNYTLSAIDPDNGDIKYYIDWGDGTNNETGPCESGEEIITAHKYEKRGKYTIKVTAIDAFDEESPEGTLEVQAPLNQPDTTDSIFGWTIIRGWVANMKKQGNDLYFRAVRLHYLEITGMEMSTGIIKLKRIRISDMGPDRQLTFGPLGSLTWIFGFCHGGLTEL